MPTRYIPQLSTDPNIFTFVHPYIFLFFCRALPCSKRCGRTHPPTVYLILIIVHGRTRHCWAPRHNPMQLRCDSPTRKNTLIIAHEKKCYQGAKILLQHIVTVVTNVTVPTRTTDDEPSAPPNAAPPLTHIYIKTYEPAMLTGVASSLSQGPSRCPLSNNERHRNCKKNTHTHLTRSRYAIRCPSSLSRYIIA